MIIDAMNDFATKFNSNLKLNEHLIVKKENRFFLINEMLKKIIQGDFYCAGVYLGKIKDDGFFPSFELLNMLAKKNANKTVVDQKTAWLFICGRDVFRQGVINAVGSNKKGAYTLIINKYGECLGFGRILRNLDEAKKVVVIQNILDIGDFLRREASRQTE